MNDLKDMINDPFGAKLLGIVGHARNYAKKHTYYPYIRKPQYEGYENGNLVFEIELIYDANDVENEVKNYIKTLKYAQEKAMDVERRLSNATDDELAMKLERLLDSIYREEYKRAIPPVVYKDIFVEDTRGKKVIIPFVDQIINDISLFAGKRSMFIDDQGYVKYDININPSEDNAPYINAKLTPSNKPRIKATIQHMLKYGIDSIIGATSAYPSGFKDNTMSGDIETLGLTKEDYIKIRDAIGDNLGIEAMKIFMRKQNVPKYWGKDWRNAKKRMATNSVEYWQTDAQFIDYIKSKYEGIVEQVVRDEMFLRFYNDESIVGDITITHDEVSLKGQTQFSFTSDTTGARSTIGSLIGAYEFLPKFGKYYKDDRSAKLALKTLLQYDPEMAGRLKSGDFLDVDMRLDELTEFKHILNQAFEYAHDKEREDPDYKSVFFTALVKSDTSQGLYKFFLDEKAEVQELKSGEMLYHSGFEKIRDFLINLNMSSIGAPVTWATKKVEVARDKYGHKALEGGETKTIEIPYLKFGYADIEDYVIRPYKIEGKRTEKGYEKSLPPPENFDDLMDRLSPQSDKYWRTRNMSNIKCPVCKGEGMAFREGDENVKGALKVPCATCDGTGRVSTSGNERVPGYIDPFWIKPASENDALTMSELEQFSELGLEIKGMKWGSLYKQQFGELPKRPIELPSGAVVYGSESEEPVLSFNLDTTHSAKNLMKHIGHALSAKFDSPFFISYIDNNGFIVLTPVKPDETEMQDVEKLQDLPISKDILQKDVKPQYPTQKDKELVSKGEQNKLVLTAAQFLRKIDDVKRELIANKTARRYTRIAHNLRELEELKYRVNDIALRVGDDAIDYFKRHSKSSSIKEYNILYEILDYYSADNNIDINRIFYMQDDGSMVIPISNTRSITIPQPIYHAYRTLAKRSDNPRSLEDVE